MAEGTTELPQKPSQGADADSVLWWSLGCPQEMFSSGGGCQGCLSGVSAGWTHLQCLLGKEQVLEGARRFGRGVCDVTEGSIKSRVLRWKLRLLCSPRALPVLVLR